MSVNVTLSIPSINCQHCTHTIMRETKDLPGVESVSADVETKSATFVVKGEADLARVKETLVEIGYPAAG